MIKVISGCQPRSLYIMAACANVAEEFNWTVYITSGNDKKHMQNSKHYSNEALDIRSKDFPNPSSKYTFLSRVLKRLGPDYWGILENENGPNEHFHIEYDPKRPENKTVRA